MEKKLFPKLQIESSVLGFGCMRFPTKEVDGANVIDTELAEQMIDTAYKSGVTYFDTAWPYHGGESEPFMGKIMKKYPRESFTFATKLPVWLIKEDGDFETYFNKQLERLQTDYIDFYLLHALSRERYEIVKQFDLFEKCKQKQREGKIRYIGFSYHDQNEQFTPILDDKPWDFVQIQHNYIDNVLTNSGELYSALAARGIPCVIMEPVKGGFLSYLPEHINAIFNAHSTELSPASYALRWVAEHENVKVVLSGMSTPEQVSDNLATFSGPYALGDAERGVIEKVIKEITSVETVPCTGCNYCVPCPFGVAIPDVFKMTNEYQLFQAAEWSRNQFAKLEVEKRPEACQQCGACEAQCPQHIPIIERLVWADSILKNI